MRWFLPALVTVLLSFACVQADDPQVATPSPRRLAGVKLGRIPPVLYAQVPALPAGQGLLVLEVEPGSAAAKAGLRQYDVILSIGTRVLRESTSDPGIDLPKSADEVSLMLFRSGRETKLHVAPANLPAPGGPGPKAMLKPGGPPAVTVEAKSLQGDRMKVTFTFFANGSSKLEHVNCSGSVDEIKRTVKDLGQQKRMSREVQDLADLALERIRVLNSSAQKK
jgi:hypothetical protein